MYMDKNLIEYKLYQLVDQFKERKIGLCDFYSVLLNNIRRYCFWNGKDFKILFVSSFL